jgi:uncharacterized protein YjbI with pentapeptide repeats
MLKVWRALFPFRITRIALFMGCMPWLGLGSVDIAQARAAHGDIKTSAERWAWSQIMQGEVADFNKHCGTPHLDPKDVEDARWQDDCRNVSSRFLTNLLTRSSWREAVPFAGVRIKGATVGTDLDLSNAKLTRAIKFIDSRFERGINLDNTHTDSVIVLDGSIIGGGFTAANLLAQSDLSLANGVAFKKGMSLAGAKVDVDVDMTGASFDGELNADSLQVGGVLLMRSEGENKASFKEVILRGANIKGQIAMIGASFDGPLDADALHVDGNLLMYSDGKNKASFKDVDLHSAKIAGQISMIGASFDGELNADSLQVGGSLFMRSDDKNHATFKKVSRNNAKIAVDADMRGASFEATLDADALQVGGDLEMTSDKNNKARFNEVILRGANIKGQIAMNGASFDGPLNADSLQVGGSLFMYSDGTNKAGFKEVILRGANIKGQIAMNGASFDGSLNADALNVDGDFYMRSDPQNRASFKDVNLQIATITGHIDMTGALIDGTLNAYGLEVDHDLLMGGAICTDGTDMTSVHVGRNLDLRGATFVTGLDLSGASVTGDLQVGVPPPEGTTGSWWAGKNWGPGYLKLHNFHVGNLSDTRDAWPATGSLFLDGFAFDHLGGSQGETGPQMRDRGMEWWDNWGRRDPDYSPAPYAQLAAAFTNAGYRDAANEIRFLGRVRERESQGWLAWIWSGFLQYVAGFGIGTYTFRVLYWVIGISLLGALYLKMRVKGVRDGNHGFFWCFGASLSRLLPVIEINKEFSDFFNDPKRERLTGFQSAVFSTTGIIGFVLGAVLVAAVSGLTQNP